MQSIDHKKIREEDEAVSALLTVLPASSLSSAVDSAPAKPDGHASFFLCVYARNIIFEDIRRRNSFLSLFILAVPFDSESEFFSLDLPHSTILCAHNNGARRWPILCSQKYK